MRPLEIVSPSKNHITERWEITAKSSGSIMPECTVHVAPITSPEALTLFNLKVKRAVSGAQKDTKPFILDTTKLIDLSSSISVETCTDW